MKKNILCVLCALLIQVPAAQGTTWSSGNPFVEMMRSMLNMFELMQLYQDYSGYPGFSGIPRAYPPEPFSYGPPVYPNGSALRATPRFGESSAYPSLEGLWVSDANTLLLIRQDYAQIYWSRTQYKNYYLRKSRNELQFTDAETGEIQTFDMATQADQMALRDQDGNQLLFRRLSSEQLQPYQRR